MNWLIIILVVLRVVCVFGGGNDKRNALSVIEGAFAHTIEPDSPAFYQEVSAPDTYDAPPTGHAFKYSTSERNDLRRSEDTYGGRLQSRQIVRTNGGVKRAYISPYTKKLVASRQKWRCAVCNKLLDASYELIIFFHSIAGRLLIHHYRAWIICKRYADRHVTSIKQRVKTLRGAACIN